MNPDLQRLEKDNAHLLSIANDRLEQIRRLEREVDAWREAAGRLHTALFSLEMGAALESYARLSSGSNPHKF